uniref:Uncharacterized protein n=1 Tax=Glossina austeni TaxID=7395 RepID=A0A1A9VS59_GLOAU
MSCPQRGQPSDMLDLRCPLTGDSRVQRTLSLLDYHHHLHVYSVCSVSIDNLNIHMKEFFTEKSVAHFYNLHLTNDKRVSFDSQSPPSPPPPPTHIFILCSQFPNH